MVEQERYRLETFKVIDKTTRRQLDIDFILDSKGNVVKKVEDIIE